MSQLQKSIAGKFSAALITVLAGSVIWGVTYLSEPLSSGKSPMPRYYQFRNAGWTNFRYWSFGASELNLIVMPSGPSGRRPCISTPISRLIWIGPVSISH